MIITKLRGGLGNQMFQYAAGTALAAKTGDTLCMDLSWFRSPGSKDPLRVYELGLFGIKPTEASPIRALCTRIFGRHLIEQFKETEVELPLTNGAGLTGSIYLDGFWQSESHFEAIAGEIRAEFQLDAQASDTSTDKNSVCVHIRRTDYVTRGDFIGVEYYRKATEKMIALAPGCTFFVFSDDIAWCREHLNFIPDAQFIDSVGTHSLQAMSACRHFIIPNSTFSWWAAWLAKNPSKIVIAPQTWTQGKGLTLTKIVPGSWLRI